MLFSWSVPLVMKFYQQFQLLSFFFELFKCYILYWYRACVVNRSNYKQKISKCFQLFYISLVFLIRICELYIFWILRDDIAVERALLYLRITIFFLTMFALIDQFVVKIKFISIEYKTPLRYQNGFFFMHFKCSI